MSLNAFVASLAIFAFSIGLPSLARSTVSAGRKDVPVGPVQVGPSGPTWNGSPIGDVGTTLPSILLMPSMRRKRSRFRSLIVMPEARSADDDSCCEVAMGAWTARPSTVVSDACSVIVPATVVYMAAVGDRFSA